MPVGTYICKQNVKLKCLCIPVSLDGTSGNCELPPYPGPSSFPAVVTFAEDQGLVLACGGGHLADVDREVTHAGGLKLLSVYRKSVLHLLQHMFHVHLSRCSTDVR